MIKKGYYGATHQYDCSVFSLHYYTLYTYSNFDEYYKYLQTYLVVRLIWFR